MLLVLLTPLSFSKTINRSNIDRLSLSNRSKRGATDDGILKVNRSYDSWRFPNLLIYTSECKPGFREVKREIAYAVIKKEMKIVSCLKTAPDLTKYTYISKAVHGRFPAVTVNIMKCNTGYQSMTAKIDVIQSKDNNLTFEKEDIVYDCV